MDKSFWMKLSNNFGAAEIVSQIKFFAEHKVNKLISHSLTPPPPPHYNLKLTYLKDCTSIYFIGLGI